LESEALPIELGDALASDGSLFDEVLGESDGIVAWNLFLY